MNFFKNPKKIDLKNSECFKCGRNMLYLKDW